MFERFFFFPILVLLLTVSCSEEGEFNQTSEGLPVTITEKIISDYSTTEVNVLIRGQVSSSLSEIDRLQFYSNNTCKGSILGQALVSEFKSEGLEISVPINTTVDLYVSTEASSDCVLLEKYSHEALLPREPVFTQTIPVSPTRITTTPGVFGSAFPPSGSIDFYDDNTCLNLIAQGAAADFSSTGIPVTVTANVITSIHAIVRDVNGGASSCQHLVDYDHSNQISGPPQLISVSHMSPNKDTHTPIVRGSTAVGSISVELYSDAGCLSSLASGDPADFENTGFQITGIENGTIQIYAKSLDDQNQPSVCALLTSFTHDDISPLNASYLSVSPTSPTNQTTQPLIVGTSPADAAMIMLYDANTCLNVIGSGSKSEFESTGTIAGIQADHTTNIYGKVFDAAGNDSLCTFFTAYTHNTTPPSLPTFATTNPESPTNVSTTPFIIGVPANRTVNLRMYDDENCTNLIGQGTPAEYAGSGIQVTAGSNTTTDIYVTVSDIEGNVSACTFHAGYDHSTNPAPNPGFFATFPASPSRASYTPTIIGTADGSITTVSLYSEATCTNLLGSGTRGQYTSSGITVTLPQNSTNDIYAQALDEYSNLSSCVLVTQYIHNTIAPLDPTYASVSPLSPNNSSLTPSMSGASLDAPTSQLPVSEVSFFDSPSCISKLGDGTAAEFAGGGITINVPQNTETFIYAKSFDEAGNFSNCVYMTNYIHNGLVPGAPNFLAVTPGSPSYSEEIQISGNFAASPDFMPRTSMIVYSDAACTSEIATVNPAEFEGAGVTINVGNNVVTDLYAVSLNQVGTRSVCSSLTSFRHYDDGPAGLALVSSVDGSILLNWLPDTTSSPIPTYSVERSLFANGPFSVIASGLVSNSYRDLLISDNTEYFYRVFATNSTGRSRYSSAENITTAAPPAAAVASLSSLGMDAAVTLSWSGFPQNMVYKISRSTNFGGPFVDLGLTLTTTTYVDTDLTNNQTYYYVVTASNPSGDTEHSNVTAAVPKITPSGPTEFTVKPIASLDACGGAGGAVFTWTAPQYYTNFQLLRDIYKSNTSVLETTSSLKTERCSIPGNELYYYAVKSGWGSNNTVESEFVGFYTRSAPSFTVHPGDGAVHLSWTSPGLHTDLSGLTVRYDLYSASDYKGDYDILVAGTTSLSYVDTVVNGDARYYYIQAYVIDLEGDKVYVGYPSQIQGVSPGLDPAAPTNLVLSKVGGGLRLDWTPPTHYNEFKVYTSSNFGGPYTEILQVGNPLLVGVPVVTGMNYFKVATSWGAFTSADSNIVSYREATITGFTVTPSASEILLNWNDIGGVQDYSVLRATNLSGPYVSIATPVGSTYTDTTAVSGVGYYYRVQANFADATSGAESQTTPGMRTDSSTPSNISLTVETANFIKVEWPLVNGASRYVVSRASSIGGPYVDQGISFTNTFNLTGLTGNTEHFVRVAAKVGVPFFTSAPVSAWTYTTPNAPIGIAGNNQVDLTWSTLPGVTDYDVLRSDDGVTYSTLTSSYASTSYLDLTAVNGTSYFYKVQANYPNGVLVSDQGLAVTPGITPRTPSQLRAENNSTGTEIELSWAQVEGVTAYNVYMATSSGAYGAPVRSSSSNLNVRVTGLTTGTTYYFSVTALKGSIETAMSNEVVAIPQLEDVAPVGRFSNSSTVEITWAAVGGALSYDLLRSSDGLNFDIIANNILTTTYLDSTVDPNKTYYYRYRGYGASSAEMSLSQVSSGVNLSEVPLVPLGFFISANVNTSVDLFWTASPSVESYEILRGTVSGGPYTLVDTVLSTETSYTDTSVVPGTRYFYVVRSLSLSGVPSPNSVEKSIELIAGPSSLAAVNGASTIDLSWGAIGGAVSYNLYRSLIANGPYGLLVNVGGLTHSDSDIVADKTYYYVVEGVFADGSSTLFSTEESILRSGYLSLQVAVEMTDGAMSSSSGGSLVFERTQTSFDTDAYDGVSSYELEIIASNTDVAARQVSLVDASDSTIGGVSISGSTFEPTRVKMVVTPNVGLDYYRVLLDQTSSDGDLIVYSVKLLVNQVNATKTKLYFPLLSSENSPSNQDASAFSFSTSDEVYADFESALMFRRRANDLKKIIDYNAWELEAVVSTQGTSEGVLGLQNLDNDEIVSTTETRFSSNSIQLASVQFDEGSLNFDETNENNRYGIRIKCEYECSSGAVRAYKAGLWVSLENLASARLVHRITHYQSSVNSQTDFTDTRAYLDLASFSSPTIYLQAVIQNDVGSSGDVELMSTVQNSGAAGLSSVAGSSTFVSGDGVDLYLSSAITPPTNNNFVTRVTPSAGDIYLRDASFVLKIGN